ncbi:MAG: D-2-hydroxyacid dehydrogenase [Planctomycetota bacterium]|jgi:glycerate dehydrogenase
MRIVVLDGHTLNPGDLDWRGLEGLGDLTVHERSGLRRADPRGQPAGTEPLRGVPSPCAASRAASAAQAGADEVVERSRGAEVVITNKAVLDRAAIEALPELRYIGVTATGYNVVDIDAARAKGIVVTNVPGYGTESVAQAAFALLLELTNHVGLHSDRVRDGAWAKGPDFCAPQTPLVELAGLTMGIVGYGAIGRAVARRARAFGMDVIASTKPPQEAAEVRFVGLDELFREADVVSLHCPLTPETEGLVDAERISSMKETAFLVNTARGPLIDECALAEALNEGRIAGAALDVLSVEPPPEDNPLLSATNCVVTPHVAWATRASRERLMDAVVGNLKAYLKGEPVNVVS